MSIIAIDGFDLYGPGDDDEQDPTIRHRIWSGTNNFHLTTYESRNFGNAMRGPNLINLNAIGTGPQSKHFIVGIAYRVDLEPSDFGSEMLRLPRIEGGNALLIDTIPPVDKQNPDYRIRYQIYNGTLTEFGGTLARDVWNYLELEVDCTGTGTVKIWINGSLLVDETIDPNTTMQDLLLSLFPYTLDDMYWLDGVDASQGATFQARLGPVQIRPVPLSSDQVPSEMLSSQGGDKYLDVGEQPGPNDKDATYMYTQQAPQTQMFGVTAHDALQPILALTQFAVIKQSDPTTGAAQVSFLADDGTVEESPVPMPLQSVYRMHWQDYVTMPDGSPIDVPKIEAAKWGIKILPDNT